MASSSVPWVVIGQVLLDSAIQLISSHGISFSDRTCEGRVLDWGRVSKSISPFAAGPQTSDAVFRMADTDHKWRDLSLTQTFRGRMVRLRFAPADSSALSEDPFWTGEIVKSEFGPGYLEITARDNSWSWMDEEVPALLKTASFPYILSSTEGAFAKIIFGDVNHDSPDGSPVGADRFGAISLDHLGPVGGVDRYCVARHAIYDIEVFRRTSASPDFSSVDPSEYNVSVSNLSVDGYIYEMTFIDFLAVQDSGAVISANVKGLYFRPAVGSFPAEGFDPTLNPSGVPGELHNPIDGFLNFMRLDCRKALLFDYDGIMAVRTTFENVGLVSGGTQAYDASGVIDSADTRRAILSKYLPCFMLDMFHNRLGEITLRFTQSGTTGGKLYSDRVSDGPRHLIGRESFIESDPNPIANRCVLPAIRHYASNTWLWTGSYENFYDQAAASIPERDTDDVITSGRNPRIEPITMEFWFSRDPETIRDVAFRRMAFMALRSYQQTFDLPTPEVIDEIELCEPVSLTHRYGLDSGGYVHRELKTFGISMHLKGFKTTLSTVRNVAGSVFVGSISVSDVVIYGTASIEAEAELDVSLAEYEFLVSASASSSDSISATTPTIDTTGADLLVAVIADTFGGTDLTDNYGNIWHRNPPSAHADELSELEEVQIWWCRPDAVGPFHAFTGTSHTLIVHSQPSIAVAAFKASSSSPFDVENGAFRLSAGTTIQPGSITPSLDNELIVTGLSSDTFLTGTVSIDSGFTVLENQAGSPNAYPLSIAYKLQTSASAENPRWDTGGVTAGLVSSIASFKRA